MKDIELLLDRSQLLSLNALNRPGEPNILAELIDIFCRQTPDILKNLQDQLKMQDYEQGKALAHKLKGSCANIGASKLASLALALEEQLGSDQKENLEILLEQINTNYPETVAALRQFVKQSDFN